METSSGQPKKLGLVVSTSRYTKALKSLKHRKVGCSGFSISKTLQTHRALQMIDLFKKQGASVVHLSEPTVAQLRTYLRADLLQAIHDNGPVQLLVYVTGHSFQFEEGIRILLNEAMSLTTRKNPYPLQHTLAELCAEHRSLQVQVFNDCCWQPMPEAIKEALVKCENDDERDDSE